MSIVSTLFYYKFPQGARQASKAVRSGRSETAAAGGYGGRTPFMPFSLLFFHIFSLPFTLDVFVPQWYD